MFDFWQKSRNVLSRINPFRVHPGQSVFVEDLINADYKYRACNGVQFLQKKSKASSIAFVISPPSPSSGGHQNAFRFIKSLEKMGYSITVYLYSTSTKPAPSILQTKKILESVEAYPRLEASFEVYTPSSGFKPEHDLLMACDWETAYAVASDKSPAKKGYFVQDFEPSFYPSGTDYSLAENTYKLGLHGFVAGKWLAHKLFEDYGMVSDYYDFAVDTHLYELKNFEDRKEILFYSRPPTPRRGTEFGLIVLEQLHLIRPDIKINLVGWDMSSHKVNFKYENHGPLSLSALADLYNRCAAGLVFSLSNVSLLPLEMMASGVTPVVNDTKLAREVLDNDLIQYVDFSIPQIIDILVNVVDSYSGNSSPIINSESVKNRDWDDPEKQFINSVNSFLNN